MIEDKEFIIDSMNTVLKGIDNTIKELLDYLKTQFMKDLASFNEVHTSYLQQFEETLKWLKEWEQNSDDFEGIQDYSVKKFLDEFVKQVETEINTDVIPNYKQDDFSNYLKQLQ